MMVGGIRNPQVQAMSIILTAVEEAFLRATLVSRDTALARWLGRPEMSDAELSYQRKVWAASSGMGMLIEVVSIITCRTMYVAFRPHRFVVNFAYGSTGSDTMRMASVSTIVVSAFAEIFFELIVDGFAIQIEAGHGVDLDEFWTMWRRNSAAFTGIAVMNSITAIVCVVWAFKQ